METLSNKEQAQLEALLAKQQKAEEDAKKYNFIIKTVEDRIEYHKKEIEETLAKRALIEEAFEILNAIDSNMFELEEHVNIVKRDLFYSEDEETRKYAMDKLSLKSETLNAEISSFRITVKAFKNLYVNVEKYAKKYDAVKIHYKFSGDYSNRTITQPKTIVKKVDEKIAEWKRNIARKNTKETLKSDAIELFESKFEEATVEIITEWKRTHGHRGRDIELILCTYQDGLEMKYTFDRHPDGHVRYSLHNVNFSVMSALKAGYSDVELVEKMQQLRGNL